MSFNEFQIEHMKELAAKEPNTLCWCGWYDLGKCPNCKTQHSAAEKIAQQCTHCGNAPSVPGAEMIHLWNCVTRKQ